MIILVEPIVLIVALFGLTKGENMKLKPGMKVECRFFNTPDAKFYGNLFIATVIEKVSGYDLYPNTRWLVDRDGQRIELKRKEIMRLC